MNEKPEPKVIEQVCQKCGEKVEILLLDLGTDQWICIACHQKKSV